MKPSFKELVQLITLITLVKTIIKILIIIDKINIARKIAIYL